MRIVIASDQERSRVFAEVYEDAEQWAEVSHDAEGRPRLRVFGGEGREGRMMDLDAALNALAEARRRLEADEQRRARRRRRALRILSSEARCSSLPH